MDNKIDICKQELDICELEKAITKYRKEYKKSPSFIIMNEKTANLLYNLQNDSEYYYGIRICLGENYESVVDTVYNIPIAIRKAFKIFEVEIV